MPPRVSHVCIGSHAFAMLPIKKLQVCRVQGAGYIDDPLPNIVYIAIWMPACIQLNYVVVSGQFFSC